MQIIRHPSFVFSVVFFLLSNLPKLAAQKKTPQNQYIKRFFKRISIKAEQKSALQTKTLGSSSRTKRRLTIKIALQPGLEPGTL